MSLVFLIIWYVLWYVVLGSLGLLVAFTVHMLMVMISIMVMLAAIASK